MKIPSEERTSEVENKQDKVTNRTEKDNKPNNQEDQQGESSQQDHENKPKNTAALRQQLLSPKKDSDAGKKKKSKKRRYELSYLVFGSMSSISVLLVPKTKSLFGVLSSSAKLENILFKLKATRKMKHQNSQKSHHIFP